MTEPHPVSLASEQTKMCGFVLRKQCLVFRNARFPCQKLISCIEYSSKLSGSFQCAAETVDRIQCLVINLVMLPIMGPVEIICPVNEASSRAEMTKPLSLIYCIVARIFSAFLLVNSMVPLCACHKMPTQVSDWQGVQTDFSSLDLNPACARSALIMSLV